MAKKRASNDVNDVMERIEVNALTKSIEEKMVRLGDLQVQIVEMKEDLDDTSKAYVGNAHVIQAVLPPMLASQPMPATAAQCRPKVRRM